MPFSKSHLNKNWTIYIFIAEGVAEEHIFKILTKNNYLIPQLTAKNIWQKEIINMDGKDNIRFNKVLEKIELEYKDLSKSHFIILGDEIINKNIEFDKNEEDKNKLKDLFGEKYNDHITYINISPTMEIMLIHSLNLYKEFKKYYSKSAIKFLTNNGHDKRKIKSRKFWEANINKNNILKIISLIKSSKDKLKDSNRNIVDLSDIVKKKNK